MDLDDEMEPLVCRMTAIMERLQREFVPALAQLDEDAVVSQYELQAQARLYLSAAFTLAMSVFSLDKLQNETHRHRPRVESQDNIVVAAGGSPCDARLLLQIERIMDVIKKLKEISQNTRPAAASASTAEPSTRKRVRSEEAEPAPPGPPSAPAPPETGDSETDLGDKALFTVVDRPEHGVGKVVGKLLARAQQ